VPLYILFPFITVLSGFQSTSFINIQRSLATVPPVPLASRDINHLVKYKAKGTLIVPKWTSPFWPLIVEDGLEYKSYV
jgi:hypothetical protein